VPAVTVALGVERPGRTSLGFDAVLTFSFSYKRAGAGVPLVVFARPSSAASLIAVRGAVARGPVGRALTGEASAAILSGIASAVRFVAPHFAAQAADSHRRGNEEDAHDVEAMYMCVSSGQRKLLSNSASAGARRDVPAASLKPVGWSSGVEGDHHQRAGDEPAIAIGCRLRKCARGDRRCQRTLDTMKIASMTKEKPSIAKPSPHTRRRSR